MGKTAFGSLGVKNKLEIDVPDGLASGGDIVIAPVGDVANIGVRLSGKGTGFVSGAMLAVYNDTSAAGAQVDAWFFVASRKLRVKQVRAVHRVVGGASAAVMVEKVTTGQAPAAGADVLAANIDLTATADTPVNPTLSATDADLVLAAGEGLCVDYSGTLTGLRGVSITVLLVPEP